MARIFVTGIGTGVGKTLVSAILTEKLQADYWKPVQSGYPPDRDSDTVKNLISNSTSVIHPEAYVLKAALSPHAAARMEGIEIQIEHLTPPLTERDLIIEGAGGILVPLNQKVQTMLDLAMQFNAQVVLVSRDYLGSINHTLLSAEVLKHVGIPIAGIVFSGTPMPDTREIILQKTGLPLIGMVPELEEINPEIIRKIGAQWNMTI
jgi:dethiobiotin synthetase